MKLIPVQDAVGMVLAHDITEIVVGRYKGPAYRRGQVIRFEDIERLRDLGKEHIGVLDLKNGWLHEDEAAVRIATAAAGRGIELSSPAEGRVNLAAVHDGLLKIRVNTLETLNMMPDLMFATLHTNRMVRRGQVVAGTRIIPLTIENSVIALAESVSREDGSVVSVYPLTAQRIGVITTGSEIYHHRIEDTFGPVVKEKITGYGSRLIGQLYVPDDIPLTVEAISKLIQDGAEIILLTGGMSVDPDDLTPSSIRATGAKVITYGAPVLPGAMFMLAYLGDIPLIGLPGCVMYHQVSILDLILPRILAGECLTRQDIVKLGHGGLCGSCSECRYPLCPFGK